MCTGTLRVCGGGSHLRQWAAATSDQVLAEFCQSVILVFLSLGVIIIRAMV